MVQISSKGDRGSKVEQMAETRESNERTPNVCENVAIIFGVTGLVGRELAKKLVSKPNWKVYGVARNPETFPIQNPNYKFISCDLLNHIETHKKLSSLHDITYGFYITWASQHPLDSPECCEQNKAMLSNSLNAILPTSTLKHFSLQTGMSHYAPPSDGLKDVGFYHEDSPRARNGCNFYYVLEDLLSERLDGKVGWSVHRPGLILGSSHRTLFNFIGSLCVYGAICKHLNLPFIFGGTRECWEESYIDASDSRLVAEQYIWGATDEGVCSSFGEAFNTINGLSFTWKEIWGRLGKKLGVEVPEVAEEMFVEDFWFSKGLGDKGKVWEEIVVKEGLVQTKMEDLVNWGFLDMLFRYPVKMLGSREKSDRLGFTMRCKNLDAMLYWIDVMRDENFIP